MAAPFAAGVLLIIGDRYQSSYDYDFDLKTKIQTPDGLKAIIGYRPR